METIEARIMSLQSFKRDIVSEIVSERNAHSFTALTGDSTTSAQESSGHFEGALWGSVKAHAVGSSDGSSGVSRYASRNHTYQQWMHEVNII